MKIYIKIALYLVVLLGSSWSRADAHVEFFRAIGVDDVGTVRTLLERGFDPNALSERGQTGLYLAMREGAPRVAAVLLAHPEIRIDAANAVGETALMMAALRGQVDWLPRLLDKGAALERTGWTALHYAASGPETRAVALLLDRGARIDAPSPNRSTALMMAARYGPESSVDLLLARGADLRLRNDLGLGAADFARLGGREALAERLQRLER
ncbi:MAG: ankyrin repeat domain-containing protein [Rubrivivax sp.]|nr:ankyrin repeat domain-containing protein [Rubrivivax sp.]